MLDGIEDKNVFQLSTELKHRAKEGEEVKNGGREGTNIKMVHG